MKYRVYFGDSSRDKQPKWLMFEDCTLEEFIKQLCTDYIKNFRISNNNYPNELSLVKSGDHKFVVSNLYAGFDIWCLDEPEMKHEAAKQYWKNKVRMDPSELSHEQFLKYCELICTTCGEYGYIYLSIDILDGERWMALF